MSHKREVWLKMLADPEFQRRRVEALLESFADPEVRARKLAHMTRINRDPVVIAKRVATRRLTQSRINAKLSATMIDKWLDADGRKKLMARRLTLSKDDRRVYNKLRRSGISREDALAALRKPGRTGRDIMGALA